MVAWSLSGRKVDNGIHTEAGEHPHTIASMIVGDQAWLQRCAVTRWTSRSPRWAIAMKLELYGAPSV